MIRAVFLCLLATPAAAQLCATAPEGSGCVIVPQDQRSAPLVAPGDILKRGEHSILANPRYYGLPPREAGWIYMRVGRDVVRMDWASGEVLEIVTGQTSRNFR